MYIYVDTRKITATFTAEIAWNEERKKLARKNNKNRPTTESIEANDVG